MRIIKDLTHINFMQKRWVALAISVAIILLGIGSLVTRGLNFGLDFTGGALIEVGYVEAPVLADVRQQLADGGFPDAIVQTFGTAREIVVRLAGSEGDSGSAEISSQVLNALQAGTDSGVEMRRVEFVGPQIGEELTEKGALALLWAMSGIFLYIMFRFQWRFSVGAVLALVHDVIITLGILSLFGIEFDLTVVAALLAVIGYSLNDTIVLYDRIRENFRKLRNHLPVEVINNSINQTLSRTIVTSLTTLLVLTALFVFGGEIIHSFAFTLIIGVLVGTYSSIFVASTAVMQLGVTKHDLMIIEKEDPEVRARP
jgi:preprotein translocase subunit SecF